MPVRNACVMRGAMGQGSPVTVALREGCADGRPLRRILRTVRPGRISAQKLPRGRRGSQFFSFAALLYLSWILTTLM